MSTASVRTFNLAKYLSREGWRVTVLAPDAAVWRGVGPREPVERALAPDGVEVVWTGFDMRFLAPGLLVCRNDGIRWFLGGLARRAAQFAGIDYWAGWVTAARRAARRFRNGDFDVVLASGQPFRAFPLAAELAARIGCPYVLDYRDLWTANPHMPYAATATAKRQERRLVRDAAAVSTISPSMRDALAQEYGAAEKITVVTNGYDPDEIGAVVPHDFGDEAAIVYAGQLHPPLRSVEPLMRALQNVLVDRPWRFHYYGGEGDSVRAEAERFGVTDRVVVHGNVARSEALSAVKGAALAVVITTVNAEANLQERGIVTGKVFEAIGAETPVLAIAPRGSDVEKILRDAGAGRAIQGADVAALTSYISEMLHAPRASAFRSELYAWPQLARAMDAVLRSAVRREPLTNHVATADLH